MLICPQCKFVNPDKNKFCQNCGTNLTLKKCPECGVPVPVNAQQCSNCTAECGDIWLAIIVKQQYPPPVIQEVAIASDPGYVKVGKEENSEISLSSDYQEVETTIQRPTVPAWTIEQPNYTVGSFLDPQGRYKLLEDFPPDRPLVNVRVLDCNPYQKTPLMTIVENHNNQFVQSAVGTDSIPDLALAYISLQSLCHLGIPPIHDAWQQNGMQVVLIEDRQKWGYLLDLWQDESTTTLQMVHYLYRMTQLWCDLESVGCRSSLLDLSNLRLDEDQSLALQQLYVEAPIENLRDSQGENDTSTTESLSIKHLGRVWNRLFQQSQRTQSGSLIQVLGDLELDEIKTIQELRSRLSAIANDLEANSPGVNASSRGGNLLPPSLERTASPTLLQFEELEENSSSSEDCPTMVLPMQLASLLDAGQTDVGRQRHHNEDYFGIETKINNLVLPRNRTLQARGLYILCDGMGGHAGGEVASELAVKTLQAYFQEHWVDGQLPNEISIREAVRLANLAIYEQNQEGARSGVARMGTTLVMLLIQNHQAVVAHVGDSRLYRVTRKRGLEQITLDHEVGQREICRGVEPNLAYARPDAYQLTQALGPRDENFISPDVHFFEIAEDMLFVLASDGLSDNNLLEQHYATHLEPLLKSSASLEDGVKDLIELANQYNGHDNITAVLVRAKVRPHLDLQK